MTSAHVTHLKPVRRWLRDLGATHVVVEGARIGRRRMSVHYALAQVRTMPIVDAHVNQMKGVASIAGIDPVTQTVRTIAILHQPTIRIPDGVDAEGRAAFTHRPCEEAAS